MSWIDTLAKNLCTLAEGQEYEFHSQNDFAAMIRDHMPKGGGWIKCSERMPEKRMPVLIYWSGYSELAAAEWNERNEYWEFLHSSTIAFRGEVTHWQPLPGKPEDAP